MRYSFSLLWVSGSREKVRREEKGLRVRGERTARFDVLAERREPAIRNSGDRGFRGTERGKAIGAV